MSLPAASALPPTLPTGKTNHTHHNEHPPTLPSKTPIPSQQEWLQFFDKALLISGAVALVLSLVFFIAYNWFDMGKMGKFALVEGALVLSVLAYAILAYKRQFWFGQQLLLLSASVITGVLLALFGQVYQTGADTWQLFANWALLILPFVFIARLPALWLLWLGLCNLSFSSYDAVNSWFFMGQSYAYFGYLVSIFMLNFVALCGWLVYQQHRERQQHQQHLTQSSNHGTSRPSEIAEAHEDNKVPHSHMSHLLPNRSFHWSTYIVGLLAVIYASRLGIHHTHYNVEPTIGVLGFFVWALWAGFTYWRYYVHQVDLLMLTYLCGSVIFVVIMSIGETLIRGEAGGFLLLAIILIGMSSAAVTWLRHISKQQKQTTLSETPLANHAYTNAPNEDK